MFKINSDEILGKVIIEKLALQNALSHVAEYGNFRLPRRKWKESYGLLIGKLENKDLIVNNAFPMTHGSSIFVEFQNAHYVLAAQINDIIAENGDFFVGWYHSHPGLGFFLSGTDVLTQLGFQDVNPHAIAIVFDHKQLERENEAFNIFRLYDTEEGISASYYQVNYELRGLKEESELEFIENIYYKITHSLDTKKISKVESTAKNNIIKWLNLED
ncbi:MAG: Mov34/MPN/PAD-1 family protein [Candidatus Hodarchaeota archaeon]